MRTQENFLVGHSSQIAPSQARLTWRFFRDRLLKKKMHLVGMDTLLILLSLGLGYPIPGARISHLPLLRSAFHRSGSFVRICESAPSDHDSVSTHAAPDLPLHAPSRLSLRRAASRTPAGSSPRSSLRCPDSPAVPPSVVLLTSPAIPNLP
jgi:hypothetical protein